MNKINKETLLSAIVGVILGVAFLAVNLLFSSFDKVSSSSANVEEQVFIVVNNSDKTDDLLIPLLSMFGFNVDAFKNSDKENLLLALENVSVRIVAQSSIGDDLHTLLEVKTPKETKRIMVTEGTIVNGFLIKSINNKQLVLEKDKEEYTIKLFHPKDLNQNRIKDDIK